MEKNRKVLLAILAMLVLSSVLTIFNIGIKLNNKTSSDAGFKSLAGPGVGIVRIEGAISFGTAGYMSENKGAEAVIHRLDELSKNSEIKVIVLRINSPGGSVSATQEIYQKLWKIRKKNIPLIASMGEVAASGGYYIASACNVIIANPGTITGSIGVIAASPNLKLLFEKLGIRMNVIKSGKYKDMLSSHRDMPPDELELVQEIIDQSYGRFLKDVALGRNMAQSDIEPYADGRVFSGEKALQYKLIDKIGTFEDAIDHARTTAKLGEDAPVYEDRKTPIEMLLMSISRFSAGAGGLSGIERAVLDINNNPFPLEYRLAR